jgi:hypothetical protein
MAAGGPGPPKHAAESIVAARTRLLSAASSLRDTLRAKQKPPLPRLAQTPLCPYLAAAVRRQAG